MWPAAPKCVTFIQRVQLGPVEFLMRLFAALTLFFSLTIPAAAAPAPASKVTFEPNIGQVSKSVDWVVRQGSGTPIFLRATGAAITRYDHGRAEFIVLQFDGARD